MSLIKENFQIILHRKMRNLMLVAVILQLVITVDIYGFGDIIAFKTRCAVGNMFTYKHFAVYVGNETLPGKKPGEDIFERLITLPLTVYFLVIEGTPPKCVFSKLDWTQEPVVANYLDGYKDRKRNKQYNAGSEAEIIGRINEKFKNCGAYLIAHNNCEHLATYVRYGVKVALQKQQDLATEKRGVSQVPGPHSLFVGMLCFFVTSINLYASDSAGSHFSDLLFIIIIIRNVFRELSARFQDLFLI
uniref:LRAT domain-containing protein n=1 Tax=Dicentrarchus labrax TaxID=13489 RepID=A0A8P4G9F7_DICLA